MPNSGYFDVVFASSGDKTAVPDPIQVSGSISYTQGWTVNYQQDPTINPATALLIDRAQTNQIFFDITTALQQYQQFGTPPFITTAMNNGTPFSYAAGARVVYLGVVYQSLVGSNADTPPSSKWATGASGRSQLNANTTFYVATTGNDSTGTGAVGAPWLTVQHAVNVLAANYDFAGFQVTIQIADGTYTGNVTVQGLFVGQTSALVIQGNTVTPDNVVIACSSGTNIIVSNNADVVVTGMKLSNSNSAGVCMNASNAGQINFSLLDFGATGSNGIHLYTNSLGFINASGNYTISGNSGTHIAGAGNGAGVYVSGVTVTLTGTPAFTSFANMNHLSFLYVVGTTFTGAATGIRYAANENSVISTNGGGANFLPGNSPGSATNGGQYT